MISDAYILLWCIKLLSESILFVCLLNMNNLTVETLLSYALENVSYVNV